jgi:Ferritin-like domain
MVERRLTRARLLKGAALAGGGALAGGLAMGGLPEPAASRPSARQDAEILNFVLLFEHLQSQFYAQALKGAKLHGELLDFARILAGQEQEHLEFVRQALGAKAQKLPALDFGDAVTDERRFAETALKLEDLGVAAYNAQAPNLTPASLAAAAKIVSVEARHAAWIRDIVGENPAPDAAEPVASPERVMKTLRGSGFVK